MAAHEKQFSWTTRYNPAVSFCVLRVCSTQDGVRPKGVYAHKTFLFRYVWMRTRETRMLVIFEGQKVRAPSRKVLGGTMGFHKNNFVLIGFCDSLGFSMTTLIWKALYMLSF